MQVHLASTALLHEAQKRVVFSFRSVTVMAKQQFEQMLAERSHAASPTNMVHFAPVFIHFHYSEGQNRCIKLILVNSCFCNVGILAKSTMEVLHYWHLIALYNDPSQYLVLFPVCFGSGAPQPKLLCACLRI